MADWWPSQRVPQGGIMHPAKVKDYSPETHKMLKELMQESKLTMQQRNKINYYLRTGEPLPNHPRKYISNRRGSDPSRAKSCNQSKIVLTDRVSKLRSHSAIIMSGAYERDKFVRTQPLPDREQAKIKLQEFMEYGKAKLEMKLLEKHRELFNLKEERQLPQKTRFEQLKDEITERLEWLEEMEQLGEGKKYKKLINQQVAEKLRQIEQLSADKPKKKMQCYQL